MCGLCAAVGLVGGPQRAPVSTRTVVVGPVHATLHERPAPVGMGRTSERDVGSVVMKGGRDGSAAALSQSTVTFGRFVRESDALDTVRGFAQAPPPSPADIEAGERAAA